MRILYIITKSNWGGAQKYVFDMATASAAKGHEVVVAAGGTGEKNADPGVLAEKLQKAGIQFIFLPEATRDIFLVNDVRVLIHIYTIIRDFLPDVVHLNSSKIGGLGALAARFKGIRKVIFTAHGFAFDEDRPAIARYAIAFLSWLTVLLSTDTIIITGKDAKHIEHWPLIAAHKINLIRNGIKQPDFLPQTVARKALDETVENIIPTDAYWIGSIGELHPNKNFDVLLEAFAVVLKTSPNARLLIIGEGEERHKLEQSITRLKITEEAMLCGYLTEASRYLEAFDFFVLPSKKEGLPYVLIEAGFAERPVIATSVGAIPELIGNEKGIIVLPNESGPLSQAITELIENPAKARELAANLHKETISNYTYEKMVDNTIALYER